MSTSPPQPTADTAATNPAAAPTDASAAGPGPAARTQRFLTVTQVADELNVSTAQVYALLRDRSLLAIKVGGRGQWRVERDKLEDYITRAYADAVATDPTDDLPPAAELHHQPTPPPPDQQRVKGSRA